MSSPYLKPRSLVIAASVLSLLGVGVVLALQSRKPVETYVRPEKGDIVEQVLVTGTVKAATDVDLSFEIGGSIVGVGPAVGAHVLQGTPLAALSRATLQAQLEQAQAALAVQQAKLDGLKAGARTEDISVAQTAVSGAQSSVAQAKESLIQAVRDGYVKADDAIHNKVDQFFTNPRTPMPTLSFTTTDSSLTASVISGRVSEESDLSAWETSVESLPTTDQLTDPGTFADTARTHLQMTSDYLTLVAQALTEAVPNTYQPTAAIQGYQANVAIARANVSAALAALNAAATQETAAESAVASAQSQLVRTKAPALATDIQAQEAQIAVAQANVDAAQTQLNKTVLTSPMAGTITRNDAHVGETAAPGVPLISIDSDMQFQMETYVSEADIAKIKKGDTASVALDAYKDDTFPAHVITVDPAATTQNGINGYKVTLQFDGNDTRIKEGLTGNITIITQTKNAVLRIPNSAVVKQGDQQFVMRKTGTTDELLPITTGIVDANGYVEVTSGLSEDDQIKSFGDK